MASLKRALFRALRAGAIFVALAALAPRADGGEIAAEYELKAAFLYNFAKFVEWPGEAGDAPLVVCIVGTDPFGEVLDRTVAGKTVHGRPLAARRLRRGERLDGCHELFVSSSEESELRGILDAAAGLPILTISDIDRFAERGGMISLVLDQRRVRLEINPGAAGTSGLKLSSQLLQVASLRSTE